MGQTDEDAVSAELSELIEGRLAPGFLGRADIEAEIRNGVKHGEFEVYYQPIVNMRSRNTEGFEALP